MNPSVPVPVEQLRTSLLDLLGETIEKSGRYYLDKDTSLFETLETISAEVASKAVSGTRSTIAAHVEHVRFYLDVNLRSIQGEAVGQIDWKESWRHQRVTSEEWEALKGRLRQAYTSVLATVKGGAAWDRPEDLSDTLAILAHTSYHLGAIRQALGAVKG
jgi:hypothetical protein